MLKRIITAVLAITAFIPICIFSQTIAFPMAMAFLSAVAVFEMIKCIGQKRIVLGCVSILIGFASPVLARTFGDTVTYMRLFCAAAFFYLLFVFSSSVFSHGKYDVKDASVTFAAIFYVVGSFTSIVLLRDSRYGYALYLLAFIGPWISDSAAYFCGRAFGKHKLIPDVSPKKTIEGSVGAVIFTGIGFAVYGLVISKFFFKSFSPSYFLLVLMGALASAVSQIGDLIASLIKRKYGIKDYGKLFPGHGGVMDRFDSVLATAPIILFAAELSSIYNIFG